MNLWIFRRNQIQTLSSHMPTSAPSFARPQSLRNPSRKKPAASLIIDLIRLGSIQSPSSAPPPLTSTQSALYRSCFSRSSFSASALMGALQSASALPVQDFQPQLMVLEEAILLPWPWYVQKEKLGIQKTYLIEPVSLSRTGDWPASMSLISTHRAIFCTRCDSASNYNSTTLLDGVCANIG